MEAWQLAQMQSLPLEAKIVKSQLRIKEWYEHFAGEVYVSFSGGKDSTVLLHLVREMYPDVPAVFVDTGLEFPEIRDFVKTIDDVIWLKPAMGFRDVLTTYGYPVVSKRIAQYVGQVINTKSEVLRALRTTGMRGEKYCSYSAISKKWLKLIDAPFKVSDKCCDIMKKRPTRVYHKETGRVPFIGTLAAEGKNRELDYLRQGGCNVFDAKAPKSTPMSFWLEEDVWDYIKRYSVRYASIYDMGYARTGCVFCAFGAHLEKPVNRFQRLYTTHPKLWKYCMEDLGMQGVLDFIGIQSRPVETDDLGLKKKRKAQKEGERMEAWQLAQMQSLPLEAKIVKSQLRIKEWYEHFAGEVYVSFSGGKDSTVLLHLVRELYPDVPAVFVDTGLEFPEIKQFVRGTENVEALRPLMPFKEVLETHGYPVVSKKVSRTIRDLQNPKPSNATVRSLYLTGINSSGKESPSFKLAKRWYPLIDAPFKVSEQCCDVLKKQPLSSYEKREKRKPFIGTLACDSRMRRSSYLQTGCNSFQSRKPNSTPLSFWSEQDILQYLRDYKVDYCSVYGAIEEDARGNLYATGESRTGCIFCTFGCHMERGKNRFQRLYATHPKLWKYCMEDLGMQGVLDFIGIQSRPVETDDLGLQAERTEVKTSG